MMQNQKLYILLIVILLVNSCQKEFQYPISAEKITGRIRTYECLDVKVAAVKTAKGLIIIDTGRSPSIMSEIKKHIERDLNCSTYFYVINTHGHWDHVSGNQIFPDSILVGHEKCLLFMKYNPGNHITNVWRTRYKLSEMKKNKKENEENIAMTEIMLNDLENNYVSTPPTITFADSFILDAGDIILKLIYCGNAHTNNDIIIYVPEEKAVCTGDLFNMRGSYSFTMHKLNDIPRLISVLEQLLKESSGVEYVIPSHTPVMTRGDLIALKELLEEEYDPFRSKSSAVVYLRNLIESFKIQEALHKYETFKKTKRKNYYFMEEEFRTYGKQLYWEGKDTASINVFKLGLLEFPESALLYDNLGGIYLHYDKVDSAIHYYKKSLEIFPENRNASEILRQITNGG